MWIHRFAGTIILLVTYIMGFLAIKNLNWEVEAVLHNLLGFSILVVVLLIVIAGVVTRSMMNRLKWRTKNLLRLKTAHKVNLCKYNKQIGSWLFNYFSWLSLYFYRNNVLCKLTSDKLQNRNCTSTAILPLLNSY